MAKLGTRLLKIEVDADDVTAECSTAKFTTAESDADFVSFADAAAGGARDYFLEIVAAQDLAAGTLWTVVYDSAGDEVDVTLIPYGNAVPSASEPHFTATCVVTEPDGDLVGGEADKSTSARMTFEGKWPCLAKPVKVTAP